jgi:pantothenate kinase-related protein Tda10
MLNVEMYSMSSMICIVLGLSISFAEDATHRICRLQAEFDLPLIAVLGSQSTGKSSLIESMSRVSITISQSSGIDDSIDQASPIFRYLHSVRMLPYRRRNLIF